MTKDQATKLRNNAEWALDQLFSLSRTVPRNILSRITAGFSTASALNILPDRDKSLSETTLIFAHNAYNSTASGALMPNQSLSIPELLDVGARGLELDLHYRNGAIRMCHEICSKDVLGGTAIVGMNHEVGSAFKDISAWLTNNSKELVVLKLEDYLDKMPQGMLEQEVLKHFDPKTIFTPADLKALGHWPSINEMVSQGKSLILMPKGDLGSDLMFDSRWSGLFKQSFLTGTIAAVRTQNFDTATRLLEVREDQPLIGHLEAAKSVPFLRHYISNTTENITKEDIGKLKDVGINIISLDHLEKPVTRLVEDLALRDIANNNYLFIPAALVAAAVSSIIDPTKSKIAATSRMLLEIVASLTLPIEGAILYRATKKGIGAYQEEAKATNLSAQGLQHRAKKVLYGLKAGISDGINATFYTGGSRMFSRIMGNSAVGLINKGIASAGRAIIFRTLYEPVKGAVTGLFTGDIVTGMLKGFDSSMFGLTNFSSLNNPANSLDTMITSQAKSWNTFLTKHSEIIPSEEAYNRFVSDGITKFLTETNERRKLKAQKEGKELRAYELLTTSDIFAPPSFSSIEKIAKPLRTIQMLSEHAQTQGIGLHPSQEKSADIASLLHSSQAPNSSTSPSPKRVITAPHFVHPDLTNAIAALRKMHVSMEGSHSKPASPKSPSPSKPILRARTLKRRTIS